MKKWLCLLLIVTISMAWAGDFGAYYTRLAYDDDNLTGKYADIIVRFGPESRFVFSRESSYLPYWETAEGKWYVREIIPRKGNGPAERPDKYNFYSYARIIENTPEKVIIHWRYIPDFDNLNFDGVVHEIFEITPDGKVERKIRQGRKKLSMYRNTRNVITQTMTLGEEGIKQLAFAAPKPLKKVAQKAIRGARVIKKDVYEPVAWWKMDEGLKVNEDKTLEAVTGQFSVIGGNGALWKRGVSGTTLAFDGYFTRVVQPAEKAPSVKDALTVEAWTVLGVYPYDWVAFAHQCDWEEKGWFFGVDEYGRLALKLSIDDEWKTLRSKERLPLNEWIQVAARFDGKTGEAALFINGKKTDTEKLKAGTITPSGQDLQLGLNTMKLPASGFPTIVGIEGLLDEVKIYDNPLGNTKIKRLYNRFKPSDEVRRNPDLEKRPLPRAKDVKGFGAHYTTLKYHDLWDNMWRTTDWADVVVKFDDLPTSVVFWRGPNYSPGFVTENNKWMIDQSVETGYEGYGCCEHMSDKQCRFAHLRIIENTPARAVVHWRYAFISTLEYRFPDRFPGTNEFWEPHKSFVDEYYTIYPDGVTMRKLYNRSGASVSWQDIQFLIPAGETPEDQMNLQALTLGDIQLWADHRFEKLELSWEHGLPENTLGGANIEWVNMKSRYKPFLIFPEGIYVHPWVAARPGFYSKFVSWNHWPAAQIPSDGRGSRFPDRLSHSALAAADNSMFHGDVVMYGFTDQPIDSLKQLTVSWNYPAPVKPVGGGEYLGYCVDERAYKLKLDSDKLAFTLLGSELRPAHNPCFVIQKWSNDNIGKIVISGESIESVPEIKQGIVMDTEGEEMLIVWLKHSGIDPVHVEIRKQ